MRIRGIFCSNDIVYHREERKIERDFEFFYEVAFMQAQNWAFQLILRISAGTSRKINHATFHRYKQMWTTDGKQFQFNLTVVHNQLSPLKAV